MLRRRIPPSAAGLIAAWVVTAPVAGQAPGDPATSAPRGLLRLQAGTLNPDDPFNATLALGASAGFEWNERRALVISYVRQSENGNEGEDIAARGRGFLTVAVEWGFTFEEQRRQQYRARLGAGALFRSAGLTTAPVIEAGLTIRYTLLPRLAVVGVLGDHLAFLPRDEIVVCSGSTCQTYVAGDKYQHNFGGLVGLEWRP
jgi:hypothetical protein